MTKERNLIKPEREGNFLNLIKISINKQIPTINIILYSGTLRTNLLIKSVHLLLFSPQNFIESPSQHGKINKTNMRYKD